MDKSSLRKLFSAFISIILLHSFPASAGILEWLQSHSDEAVSENVVGQEEKATEVLSKEDQVYLELVEKMFQKKLYYAALAHLDEFDKRRPGNRKAILLRADALRATDSPEEAKVLYESLVDGVYAPMAYRGLAHISMAQGKIEEASEYIYQANFLSPTDARILNDMGYILLLLNHLGSARKALSKANELEPGNELIQSNLVLLSMLNGNWDEAIGQATQYGLPESRLQQIADQSKQIKLPISFRR